MGGVAFRGEGGKREILKVRVRVFFVLCTCAVALVVVEGRLGGILWCVWGKGDDDVDDLVHGDVKRGSAREGGGVARGVGAGLEGTRREDEGGGGRG